MVGSSAPRPVVLVTGANAGVGFGICQRLLVQWSNPIPSDTLGKTPSLAESGAEPTPTPFTAPNGIVLLLGCRNAIKAHKAKQELQNVIDHLAMLPDYEPTPLKIPSHWLEPVDLDIVSSIDDSIDNATLQSAAAASLRRRRQRSAQVMAAENGKNTDEDVDDLSSKLLLAGDADAKARGRYRRRFCARTVIEIVSLDLGSMASVLKCAQLIQERHGYITHAILNAGLAAWEGLDWFKLAWMISTGFRRAVTWPKFKLQRAGDIGTDGYGWVWQCNVAAHYVLVRLLLPAFRASPFMEPSRIIWTGSIESYESFYHPEDYQCLDKVKSAATYEATKFQCEITALGLDEKLKSERIRTVPGTPSTEQPQASHSSLRHDHEPRSYCSHPGVVATNMFEAYLGTLLNWGYALALYIARWLFSPHHVVTVYKAGIAASFLSLTPSSELDTTIRYSSQCNFWGQEYVGKDRVDGWEPDTADTQAGKTLHSRCRQTVDPDAGAVQTEARGMSCESRHAGEHTMELARDLIDKLEHVAGEVWKKAGVGKLPPFADMGEGDTGLLAPLGAHELRPVSDKRDNSDEWENVDR
ncbi:hypothetical protein K437DRAFT_273616 [Tilletiaria anomala UBC 951]|uniref:3-keto sterol reductase n=1 Tax=Tilletiaria anomala (strain ATCC 24038 / CBS 436.72 / UBC 951) TaxID=1037660 RepID=A0A066WAG2_TILAU|nr:uncharacterized protein K437DRAFT_273616 [Tilletiaria anomala UBC 951]KDN47760.1 hypothetical protein K437DRAFT_273616 [Tilletiaria anomala UBC 951]